MGLFSVLKKDKLSTTVKSEKTGKKFTLLTPKGKMEKYKRELTENKKYTNDGNLKSDAPLTDAEKAYRMGYRSALGEQAKIYNKKNKR